MLRRNAMTDKLYYQNSHLFEFTAEIIDCVPRKDGAYDVVLDRTAFFPEGGGQRSDEGRIGGIPVLHVSEKDGIIFHRCEVPMEKRSRVDCRIDREIRLRRMQNHSGEHVVSGVVHKLFGFDNVGFHMSEGFMTVDFSGELRKDDVERLEMEANEIVRANAPVTAFFPSPDQLRELDYRSKLDLTENVRLVRIEGCDLCACCAPHVSQTGEIGIIRILDHMRHRGGTRITLTCGMDALDDYRRRQKNTVRISNLLSARQEDIADAVERLLEVTAAQKLRITELSMANVDYLASVTDYVKGNICLIDRLLDEVALRELVNRLSEKCSGIAAALFPSGEGQWRYIIGSRNVDLRKSVQLINQGINGKGGGSSMMIQGNCSGDVEQIRQFLTEIHLS